MKIKIFAYLMQLSSNVQAEFVAKGYFDIR